MSSPGGLFCNRGISLGYKIKSLNTYTIFLSSLGIQFTVISVNVYIDMKSV